MQTFDFNRDTDCDTVNFPLMGHFRFNQKKNFALSSEQTSLFANFHTSSTRQPVAKSNNNTASLAHKIKEDGMGCDWIQSRTTAGFQIVAFSCGRGAKF
jgi:hypothetical protein